MYNAGSGCGARTAVLRSTIIVTILAAALVAQACPASAMDPAYGQSGCDQGAFVAGNDALRFGRVSGAGAVHLLMDGPGCPAPTAACRSAGSVPAGQRLLLGKSQSGYVCVMLLGTKGSATGWLRRRQIARAISPVDPAPALAAWLGTWRDSDDRITLRPDGDRIAGDGEAYWPAKNIMPANEGNFAGTAKPSGNHLRFRASDPDACEVRMTLAGRFLIVDDNRMCGGHNASFDGIFVRSGQKP